MQMGKWWNLRSERHRDQAMSLERQTRKSELYSEIDAQEFRPVSQLFCAFFSRAVNWGQLEYLLHRAVVTTPWVDKWEQGLLYVKRPVLHGHCHDYVTILSALTYLCPRACPGHTSQSWIQEVARRVIALQFPRLLPCQGHQGLCQGLLHSVFPVNSL